jgi:hypothetical protein
MKKRRFHFAFRVILSGATVILLLVVIKTFSLYTELSRMDIDSSVQIKNDQRLRSLHNGNPSNGESSTTKEVKEKQGSVIASHIYQQPNVNNNIVKMSNDK